MDSKKGRDLSEEELEKMVDSVITIDAGYAVLRGKLRKNDKNYSLVLFPERSVIEIVGQFSAENVYWDKNGMLAFKSPITLKSSFSHKDASYSGEHFAVLEKYLDEKKQ